MNKKIWYLGFASNNPWMGEWTTERTKLGCEIITEEAGWWVHSDSLDYSVYFYTFWNFQ